MPEQPDQLDRLKAALADRYRIERELGHGGLATVDLAEDRRCRVFFRWCRAGRAYDSRPLEMSCPAGCPTHTIAR